MEKKIRILLADNHTGVREGLKALLKLYPGVEIVAEASDGLTTVELARKLLPDVIIMDVRMPSMNGIEATHLITQEHPDIKVIGFSTYCDTKLQAEMQNAGAYTCISKSNSIQVLVETIHDCRPRIAI
jgi:DNA-binding NarL/FixJ family response regulator